MLRLRSILVALTCVFFVTLSGCGWFSDEGRWRPFRSNFGGGGLFRAHRGADCECHHAGTMPTMEHGPTFTPPMPSIVNGAAPIPITNIPNNQPPQIFKVPQASPTPFVPAN